MKRSLAVVASLAVGLCIVGFVGAHPVKVALASSFASNHSAHHRRQNLTVVQRGNSFVRLYLSTGVTGTVSASSQPGVVVLRKNAIFGNVSRHFSGGPIPLKQKKGRQRPLPVKLSLSVGFYGQFRMTAMVPIRIFAHNRTERTVAGEIIVPDASSAYASPVQRAVYQQPLTLSPRSTKSVTLYVPAASLSSQVTVRFDAGSTVVGQASTFVTNFSQSALTVGILAQNATGITWTRGLKLGNGRWITPYRLTPATFDSVSQALSNFDVIVVEDATIASLDKAQLSALAQYVEDGGGLVEFGGPGWQQSLKPLPAALVPGKVIGTSVLSSLSAMRELGQPTISGPQGRAVVSDLTQVRGDVLASLRSMPLAVDASLGQGRIVYIAFDPTLSPISGWHGAEGLLTSLVSDANPTAAGRAVSRNGPIFGFGFGGFANYFSGSIAAEIDNVPSPALGLTIGFVILAGIFVLILGPLNFLLLGRLRRRGLLWVSIPLGAVLCTGATFGVAGATRNQSVLVNTISMVTLGGDSAQRQANVYMGLFAPIPGNYHLSLNQTAYPQSIENSYSYYSGGGGPVNVNQNLTGNARTSRAGMRLQQGSGAEMDFRRMDTWSMRNAEVSTTVNVPGNIQSHLRVNSLGHVVGWVRNATRLMLEHPVILAGRSWISLAPMAPGRTARVDVAPRLNTFKLRAESVWQTMLGTPSWNYGNAYPIPLGCFTCKVYLPASGPSGFSALPFQPANSSYPRERNFRARMRNVANMLPEAQNVTSLGEVLFIAWNQQPLLHVTVNGSAAPTRNLNLIVQPLVPQSVAPGHFLLRTGTFGAQLLSVNPARPNRNQYDPYASGLDIGAGGSATFEFQLPSADRIRFTRLTLNVNAGGANSIDMGRVWDWRSRNWVVFDLSQGYAGLTQPNRFVSPSGTVLVKLVNTDTTHDLQIYDSHASLQLSGAGYAS